MNHYVLLFNSWANRFSVKVDNASHYEHMLENYASNDDLIVNNNGRNLTYRLDHNQFSHMDREEWNQHRGALRQDANNTSTLTAARTLQEEDTKPVSRRLPLLPRKVDWSKVRGIGKYKA